MLFDRAEALMKEGKYAEACSLYKSSDEKDHGEITVFKLAECYEKTGRVVSAWKGFEDAADEAREKAKREPDSARKAVIEKFAQDASSRAAALKQRLPTYTLLVAGTASNPGISVEVDKGAIDRRTWGQPLLVDPGEHEVRATAPGKQAWTTTFRIAVPKGNEPPEAREVKVPELEAAPTPAQRKGALVVGGLGAVGLVAGAAFGIATFEQWGPLKRHCVEMLGDCTTDPKWGGEKNRAQLFADIATASFVIAGVSAATAGILWFTASPVDSSTAKIEVGPAIGPAGAGLTVRTRF